MSLNIKNGIIININEITNITSTTYSNNVTFLANKKEYTFKFKNLMDKFIFNSIIFNYHLYSISRDFIKNQMNLNISVLTWNLSSIKLPDLSSLFKTGSLTQVDILAIGVQECEYMRLNNWVESLRALGNHYDFEEVGFASLFQMFIIVFVKKDLKPLVSCVETETKAMGFAGLIGNKGCEIVSFRLMGYLLVFVNCHLAPKVFKILERNEMAQNFSNNIRIDDKFATFDVLADYVFWFGDMNYRVDYEFNETIKYLNEGKLQALRDKDQLRKQMASNKIFSNFDEKQIEFLPTYRRKQISLEDECLLIQKACFNDNSSSNSETSSNHTPINNITEEESIETSNQNNTNTNQDGNTRKKEYSNLFFNKQKQSPSWCDRILIKSNSYYEIISYTALEDIKYSDHIPVQCHYSIYLTLPILSSLNYNNHKDKAISGQLHYKNIILKYSIAEADLKVTFPCHFKLEGYYFINEAISFAKTEKFVSSNQKPFQDMNNGIVELSFEDFAISIPPSVIFDYPQMKAFNIFFVFKMVNSKEEKEIGYAKYSFENTEKNNNILNHSEELVIHYLLREMGTFSFDAVYKYDG